MQASPEDETLPFGSTLDHQIERGLNALALFPQPQEASAKRQQSYEGGDCRSINSTTMTTTSSDHLLSKGAASSSLIIGDYIGMESCVDVLKDDDESNVDDVVCEDNEEDHDHDHDKDHRAAYSERLQLKRDQRLAMKNKVFPPPIPLLARTENLPCRMPWVLKRHYTSDGRLILTEEKVRHHEYFRAHRSNGRLTLQLVPLDEDDKIDIVLGREDAANAEETDQVVVDYDLEYDHQEHYFDDDDVEEMEGGDDVNDDEEEEEDDEEFDNNNENNIEGMVEKCLNYSSTVRSGSRCILGVPSIPATIRPVHS